VLGIDPGVATTGYGVVERAGNRLRAEGAGVIRTTPRTGQAQRLLELRVALGGIISSYGPDAVAVERVFFNNNVRTAMAVGQASGIALLCAAEAAVEVADYTPSEVKRSVAGFGSASKRQVQAMVAALLSLERAPAPADAADACALAICHLNRAGLARALGEAAS
jgi:crossover junction endodeoxyribonuclease RuvC